MASEVVSPSFIADHQAALAPLLLADLSGLMSQTTVVLIKYTNQSINFFSFIPRSWRQFVKTTEMGEEIEIRRLKRTIKKGLVMAALGYRRARPARF